MLLLIEARKSSGLTQATLAQRLGKPQSYVSKCELGERQVNVVELVTICRALGLSWPEFAAQLEELIPPREGVS